jgi:hypothetical protein
MKIAARVRRYLQAGSNGKELDDVEAFDSPQEMGARQKEAESDPD